MSRRRRWPWILLALIGLACIVGVPVAIGVAMNQEEPVEAGSILELKVSGGFSEGPGTPDIMAELTGESSLSLYDLRRALHAAAADDAIAGLFLDIPGAALGFAATEELNAAIRRFAESGKPVHALLRGDMVGEGSYFLASAADTVWVSPETMWLVNGLHVDVEFYKGALDKFHVEPQFIMFKEYKSAGEPYTREEMSEHMREAFEDVFGDVQRRFVQLVAERRGLEPRQVKAVMSHGIFASPAAQEAGLVDHLGYADQIREALREHAGTEEYEKLKMSEYVGRVEDPAPEGAPTVAVVFGEGPISASGGGGNPFQTSAQIYGPKVARAIREAAEDEDVEAIVFRVNSPGGSAVGSDFIWREIERAQEAGKPVVVSMSNVAGSGGYWVAMGADAIVAHPSTITGSIGVVFGKFNLRGLYEWAGASVDSVTLSENADLMSSFASMDEAQLRAVRGTVQVMYDDFVRKVAEGRGMDFDAVEPLAHGRIWSGEDALENGLVDALGGLDVALETAREKAGIEGEAKLVVYPPKKEWIEMLLEGELNVAAPPLDHAAALEALIEELETPKVRVVMPEFRVR